VNRRREGLRCLLILNNESRHGALAREPVLRALREQGAGLIGGAPLPPQQLARALERLDLPKHNGRVVIGGGDGTLNAALPALLSSGIALGVLPLGTANDFANSLGIPEDPVEAVRVALEGEVVQVDVGRVNGKPFLNVASVGLGPKVTESLSSELKARLGFLSYPRALLEAYRRSRPFRARIHSPETPRREIRCIHLAIGNGRRYGGGALVSRDATLVDGRLRLFGLAPIPLWRMILLAPWLGAGRHRHLSASTTLRATSFRIETSRRMRVSADGEILASTPAEFDVLPRSLKVIAPVRNARDVQGLGG
jgi:diacylglycerol kinase (ATP)